MTILSTILSLFGSGLSSLFSWAITLWQKYAAQKQAASDQMNQDISAHASDGAISVGDSESAQYQIDNLDQKLKQIDQQSEPPHAP